MHGQRPEDYKYQPRGFRDEELVEKIAQLQRDVKSLKRMLARRDAKLRKIMNHLDLN